jgi:hypothetical protein
MSNNLEVLTEEKNREALLLAEVAGWMHDMGKCDERHLEQVASDHTGPKTYNYKKDHSHLAGNATLALSGESIPLEELISVEHVKEVVQDKSKLWLVRTLAFCHSAAHTEKEQAFPLMQQTVKDTRLSNSFGYESGHLTDLGRRLDGLPFSLLLDSNLPFEKRVQNKKDVKEKIEGLFEVTCADSRRPINDVSLWDWSNIVAALYKSALAAALLGYGEDPIDNIHWRLLSVRFNGAAFSDRAVRIPDLLARRKLTTDGLDRVRILLEQTYPLGTEVYRDESGSILIVPNIPELLELKNGQQKKLSTLIREKFSAGTIDNKASLSLGGEIIPFVKRDEDAWTRLMGDDFIHQEPLPIAESLHDTSLLALNADVHTVRSWWENQKEPTCPVCQLRPQGWDVSGRVDQKALERKVCSICERRREDRSRKWATEEDKLKTTIWIDEIADTSGTLALVVGKFDLTHWLDGTMVFFPRGKEGKWSLSRIALRIRCLNSKSIVKEQPVRIRDKRYEWHHFLKTLISSDVIEGNLFPQPFKDNRLHVDDPQPENVKVIDVEQLPGGGYRLTLDMLPSDLAAGSSLRIQGQDFRVAEDGVRVETASVGAVRIVEGKILHAGGLIGEGYFKLWEIEEAHTPARLQRVWETTQKFWKDCEAQLSNKDIVGTVSLRLRIKGSVEGGNRDNLGSYHTYEIKLGNLRVSVVYVEMDNDFLIIDNLRRIAALLEAPEKCQEDEVAAAAFIKGRLQKEKSLPLETPAGYGSVNKPVGSLQIDNVEEEYIAYPPALAILKEPGTFMALVPADKALKVADAIKKQYEEEMGKVRNRLPLTVGVVFAGSRTPLPAILDAGRRILSQPAEDEVWEVKEIDKTIIEPPNPGPWPSKVKLVLEREQRSICMTVRTIMGDRKTRDEWYPYWCMAFPVADAWVHVCDLRKGDKVYLTPSRFDFEFLDAAARRFEVSYEGGKRRGDNHPARPYYLEELNSFQKLWTVLSHGLTTSQIHNLVGLIETKRQEWRPEKDNVTFERVVRDILNNAQWEPRPGKTDFDQLVQAAVSGQLVDMVEFYSFLDEQLSKLVVDQRRGNL